jgi:hypothetical protein
MRPCIVDELQAVGENGFVENVMYKGGRVMPWTIWKELPKFHPARCNMGRKLESNLAALLRSCKNSCSYPASVSYPVRRL